MKAKKHFLCLWTFWISSSIFKFIKKFTYKFEDFEDSCWCPQHNGVHVIKTTTSETATTPTTHVFRGSCRCLYPKKKELKEIIWIHILLLFQLKRTWSYLELWTTFADLLDGDEGNAQVCLNIGCKHQVL